MLLGCRFTGVSHVLTARRLIMFHLPILHTLHYIKLRKDSRFECLLFQGSISCNDKKLHGYQQLVIFMAVVEIHCYTFGVDFCLRTSFRITCVSRCIQWSLRLVFVVETLHADLRGQRRSRGNPLQPAEYELTRAARNKTPSEEECPFSQVQVLSCEYFLKFERPKRKEIVWNVDQPSPQLQFTPLA